MGTFPPSPDALSAADPDRAARRMAAVDLLIDIGLEMTRVLGRQVIESGEVAGDAVLAFSRVSRAVRLAVMLSHRLEAGIAGVDEAGSAAEVDEDAAVAEAEPGERGPDREIGERERGEREADESVWLKRPISALAARICGDLGVAYDAALWEDGGEGFEARRMAPEGVGADLGSSGHFGASTPIPPLPPSANGKDALPRTAGDLRPP